MPKYYIYYIYPLRKPINSAAYSSKKLSPSPNIATLRAYGSRFISAVCIHTWITYLVYHMICWKPVKQIDRA